MHWKTTVSHWMGTSVGCIAKLVLVTSLSGIHTLTTAGAPSDLRSDCRHVKSRWGTPKLAPALGGGPFGCSADGAGGLEAIQQKTDGSMAQPAPSSDSIGAQI